MKHNSKPHIKLLRKYTTRALQKKFKEVRGKGGNFDFKKAKFLIKKKSKDYQNSYENSHKWRNNTDEFENNRSVDRSGSVDCES